MKHIPIISIDYTPAHEQRGGIGRYVRELVAALAAYDDQTPYRLFAAGLSAPPHDSPGPNFTWRTTRLSTRNLARLWHRLRIPLPIEYFTGDAGLFHATDFVLPPLRRGTRSLLTVHDLSFMRTPEATPPRLKAYLERVVPRSVARADHILADSRATKQDIIAFYQTPADKITVLYSGVSDHFRPTPLTNTIRARYDLPHAPYIIAVGSVHPRKNYARLVHALAASGLEGVHLVITGGRGQPDAPVYGAVAECSMTDRVHFAGYVDDADLPALYTGALALAYPSLYEGFGIPILEAFACGTPVIAANRSSLPEVTGEAGILFDPLDVEAMASALCRIVEDEALRETLRKRGFGQLERFSWQKAAQKLAAIYRQMLPQAFPAL